MKLSRTGTVVGCTIVLAGLQITQIAYTRHVDSDIKKYSTDSRYIIDSIKESLPASDTAGAGNILCDGSNRAFNSPSQIAFDKANNITNPCDK